MFGSPGGRKLADSRRNGVRRRSPTHRRGVALEAASDPRLEVPLQSSEDFNYPLSDPLFIEIMERAVLTLPPAQREVVLLRVEGLSFSEPPIPMRSH